MITHTCDLCQNVIPDDKRFSLSLAGDHALISRKLFALDLCAVCAQKLKPTDDNFTETITAAVKGRSARRGHSTAP